MDKLENLLNKFNLKEIYFGSEGFRIFTCEELQKAQLGYSIHPDGTDLTGSDEGDWKKEWVVFGHDTSLGDPYFVDLSKVSLPVFTAMHGTGSWDPDEVCGSLDKFLESLKYLKSTSPVDHARIDPDQSTITDEEELERIENRLCELCGEDYFWSNFVDRHKEWLEESDREESGRTELSN